MHKDIIEVADDFWNIRGAFRIAGLVNVGTHASLVRLATGKFIFLDSYTLSGGVARDIKALTENGKTVDAIINLHPFHTVHVQAMHRMFPDARLYGTQRHLARFPDLPWQPQLSEDQQLHALFKDDFAFSVPRGVDFISADEKVHFSSVLALHRNSATVHVDDTFMYVQLPALLRWFGLKDSTSLHPTLSKALQPRAGAAAEFRQWAKKLIDDWSDARNLCTAHLGTLTAAANTGASIAQRLERALRAVEGKLAAHERRYG